MSSTAANGELMLLCSDTESMEKKLSCCKGIGSIHLNGCSYFNKGMTVWEGKLADQFLRWYYLELMVMLIPFPLEVILVQLYCIKATIFIVRSVQESAWTRLRPTSSFPAAFYFELFCGWWWVWRWGGEASSIPALPLNLIPFLPLRFEIAASVFSQNV